MAASCEPSPSCRREHIDDFLECLRSQFLEMVPIRKMKWKDEDAALLVATTQLQQKLLEATVLHPVCRLHPPALSYRTSFMKQLITRLEQLDAEVCDEVYETYTDLLMQREDEDDMLCYKNYTLPCGEIVSLQESVNLVSHGTTGLSTWQAAQHLAEWVMENPDIVKDKSVLELGCGLGLTGIVTCRACSVKSYIFTDCHPQVLFLLARNIERNLAQPCADNRSAAGAEGGGARERKMLRKIKRQLSQSADSTELASCLSDSASGIEQGGSETELMTSTSESVSDPSSYILPSTQLSGVQYGAQRVADLEEKPEEEEEEISVSEDLGSTSHVKLEVSSAYWVVNDMGQMAELRANRSVRLCYLEWEQCQEQSVPDSLMADVILGADVVYDPSVIPSLVYLLRQLLEPEEDGRVKKAYIASTVRNEDTRDAFLIALSSEGLCYSVVEGPKKTHFHYDRNVPIEILEIKAV